MSDPQTKAESPLNSADICQVAHWLKTGQGNLAFTGAGISTESGIPDFRSPNGVWAKYPMVLYGEYLVNETARHEYWRQKSEMFREFGDAQPNAGHRALADWEARGLLSGIITQNIDGLHQAAGSKRVWELHGTALEVACLECRARFDTRSYTLKFLETDQVPDCPECGGILKHATVSFGQALPAVVLMEAHQAIKKASLVLAIGSSLVVEPAASLPREAKGRGAKLVIINNEETPLDDVADIILRGSAGAALNAICGQLP